MIIDLKKKLVFMKFLNFNKLYIKEVLGVMCSFISHTIHIKWLAYKDMNNVTCKFSGEIVCNQNIDWK